MENYDNIYNSICRLCLSFNDSKKMISLIDSESQEGLTPYAKAVSTFAHIGFTKQDCFPSNMCLKCLYLLKQAIQFKMITESSDECLKQLKNSVGSDSKNLKESIVEFTMLKFYFPTECFKMAKECAKIESNSEELSKVKHIIENNEKVLENLLMSNNNDENFDTSAPGSIAEQNILHDEDKIFDKIEKLNGSNVCEPAIEYKMYKNNKEVAKRKRIYTRIQYKPPIKQKQKQKKSFVCNICNKVLANKMTYRHHMQRHNGCSLICEHCGKGFPVLCELRVHLLMIHNTGPYLQCKLCPFKAPRKFELTEHERIHTGERPYTCDKCGMTFRRRYIWKKHLVIHSEKTIKCPQCPKKFFMKGHMMAHFNSNHERLYVYSCSECDVTYARTKTVRMHMAERHGIPKEKQGKITRIKIS